MSKVMFVADLHLSNSLPHSKPVEHGVTDRLLDQMNVVKQISDISEKEEVDYMMLLGDTFHKSLLDPITLKYSMEALDILSRHCYVNILGGNHESSSKVGDRRYIPEAFNEIKTLDVHYIDESEVFKVDNIVFYFLPWSPLSFYREKLKELVCERDKTYKKFKNVLLTHQSVLGCEQSGWLCDHGVSSQELCNGWDYVFAGHFHDQQTFGKNGMYVGAPMQHSFSDVGSDRGVVIVDFSSKKIEPYKINIESPKFHIEDAKDGWNVSDVKNGDYLRIDLNCTNAELVHAKEIITKNVHSCNKDVKLTISHKPIYHHEDRLELIGQEKEGEILSKYIKLSNTNGLDVTKLMDIANGFLNEVNNV